MNKTELIAAISEKSCTAKSNVEDILNIFTDVVTEALVNGDRVQLTGFGTFEVLEKKARNGRNPKTGETIEIAACKVPKFRVGKKFKKALK